MDSIIPVSVFHLLGYLFAEMIHRLSKLCYSSSYTQFGHDRLLTMSTIRILFDEMMICLHKNGIM